MKQIKIKQTSGFTIIEMLVAIAIIGFLSITLLVTFTMARIKSQYGKAREETDTIARAIFLMAQDTGRWPDGCALNVNNTGSITMATLVTAPTAGSGSNGCTWDAASVTRWGGPYLTGTIIAGVLDPWSSPYTFFHNYATASGDPGAPANTRAIASFGQDQTVTGYSDNIYVVVTPP